MQRCHVMVVGIDLHHVSNIDGEGSWLQPHCDELPVTTLVVLINIVEDKDLEGMGLNVLLTQHSQHSCVGVTIDCKISLRLSID